MSKDRKAQKVFNCMIEAWTGREPAKRTRAYAAADVTSAFHAGEGDALDEVFLGEEEDGDHRQGHEE